MREAFIFQSVEPCLDWFSYKKHEIKEEDYTYFKLNRRYGPSWWLYGMKTVDEPTYHWEETEIGEISNADLSRFIEWAKTEHGSRIVKVDMISSSFDVFAEIGNLLNSQLVKENDKLKRLNEKAIRGLRGICKECKKYESCGNRKGTRIVKKR